LCSNALFYVLFRNHEWKASITMVLWWVSLSRSSLLYASTWFAQGNLIVPVIVIVTVHCKIYSKIVELVIYSLTCHTVHIDFFLFILNILCKEWSLEINRKLRVLIQEWHVSCSWFHWKSFFTMILWRHLRMKSFKLLGLLKQIVF
jgi:hypothetical protein